MLPVVVENLSMSNVGFRVMLKSCNEERRLPIYIALPEAQAIHLKLNDLEFPRPMTHDLLKNLLKLLKVTLEKVLITKIQDDVFYAELVLVDDGDEKRLDCRPSDAIALALRFDAPISVAEEVMDAAGVRLKAGEKDTGEEPEEPRDPVEAMKVALAQAVKEERYEDAAELRDRIKEARNPS